MANEPVLGWDERVYVGLEGASTFGTPVDPSSGNAIEVVSLDMGPVQQGMTRAKRDKSLGRGMTNAFVEGRVSPIPFALETSVKSRATAATAAKEANILKAAGFQETIGATAAYALSANPTPQGLSVYAVNGTGAVANLAELGFGGAVKALNFSGGDKELTLRASGAFAGKYHAGLIDSITLAAAGTTALVVTAEESYRMAVGSYVMCESEIMKIAANDFAGNITLTRGVLGSTAVAHTAKPLFPYAPTPTLAGSPISEANCTVTLDSIATRCTKFNLDFVTGVDHLPGETGSRYVQGLKVVRFEVRPSLELVLTKELVALMGKATQRKTVALSIVCGTGAGGIVTFSMPYCELEPFQAPKPSNDIVIVSPTLRCRDSAGNDMISIVFS